MRGGDAPAFRLFIHALWYTTTCCLQGESEGGESAPAEGDEGGEGETKKPKKKKKKRPKRKKKGGSGARLAGASTIVRRAPDGRALTRLIPRHAGAARDWEFERPAIAPWRRVEGMRVEHVKKRCPHQEVL